MISLLEVVVVVVVIKCAMDFHLSSNRSIDYRLLRGLRKVIYPNANTRKDDCRSHREHLARQKPMSYGRHHTSGTNPIMKSTYVAFVSIVPSIPVCLFNDDVLEKFCRKEDCSHGNSHHQFCQGQFARRHCDPHSNSLYLYVIPSLGPR